MARTAAHRMTALIAGLLILGIQPLGAPVAANVSSGPYACRQDLYRRQPDTYPYSAHVAGIIETAEGDLLYHFDGNTNIPDVVNRPEWTIARMALSRMPLGSGDWSFPQMVENPADPDSAHNTVLFDDGQGRIHNFFTTREGRAHAESSLDYRYSDDEGHTWSFPVRIRETHGWMFGNRPFRMSNGEVIVPVYRETFPNGVGFFISDNNFALDEDGKPSYTVYPSEDHSTWPGFSASAMQAATVELEPGHLLSFMRTQAELIYKTESLDYGRTWTPSVPTQFPNPWARVDLLKTDTGNLILAYNPSSSSRTPLVLTMSEDGGVTWPYAATVEDDPNQTFSYPYLFQSSDGAIHLGYTHSPAGNMRHVVFNEEFIRTGTTIPSNSADVVYEYADGELGITDGCTYVNGEGIPGGGGIVGPYACRQDLEPQNLDHPGVHVAGLEEAPSGDLLYIFYAGRAEGEDDVRTFMSRLSVGTEDWTPPEVVFDEPGKPDGNAVLWTDDESGRIWLLFSTIMGGGWTEANLRKIYSDDDGATWSAPEFVREEWGWLFGTLPFRMTNDEVLVPIYSENEWRAGWYVSNDDLETLTPYPNDDDTTWPGTPGGSIQPATVELEPGHLFALLRTRNSGGLMYETESFDYGRTWSEAVPNGLPQNNSRIALIKLDDGTLVAAYNPVSSGRTPLALSYSTDDGATWSEPASIEDEGGPIPGVGAGGPEFSYPYLLQTSDGMIHLGYTHRRDTMRHIAFNEDFLLSGLDLPSNASQTEKTEYAGGEISQVATCSFEHGEGSDEEPADSARARKQDVRDGLAALLPTGDARDDERIQKALAHLDKSLEAGRWAGDDRLDPKGGASVFDEERAAVEDLDRVKATDVGWAIDDLVSIDEQLAQTAIDDARAAITANATGDPREIQKANDELLKAMDEMDKAGAERAKGHADRAIEHYRNAWDHAQKAIEHAEKA